MIQTHIDVCELFKQYNQMVPLESAAALLESFKIMKATLEQYAGMNRSHRIHDAGHLASSTLKCVEAITWIKS